MPAKDGFGSRTQIGFSAQTPHIASFTQTGEKVQFAAQFSEIRFGASASQDMRQLETVAARASKWARLRTGSPSQSLNSGRTGGHDFPAPTGCSFTDAPTSGAARVELRHRGGNTAFVEENQAFRRDRRDTGNKLFALFAIGFGVPLGGVERLFSSHIPRFRNRFQTCGKLS